MRYLKILGALILIAVGMGPITAGVIDAWCHFMFGAAVIRHWVLPGDLLRVVMWSMLGVPASIIGVFMIDDANTR